MKDELVREGVVTEGEQGAITDKGGDQEGEGESRETDVEEAKEEEVDEAKDEDVEEAKEDDVEEAKEEDVEEAKEEDVEGAREEDVEEEDVEEAKDVEEEADVAECITKLSMLVLLLLFKFGVFTDIICASSERIWRLRSSV